ncbi:hypothetical protein [Deinococcus koreensis]|uniref:Uncharacterized protein n=1 Tax=Deinococcus koreensis TaxID=2054903 RepID=A0A2K3URZ9_9DEIO|nr:hypothetical protein [Deinococcus koreensis]PNY79322.1 hypothetical protein CVO96_19545 [Deinococcus koreensis]
MTDSDGTAPVVQGDVPRTNRLPVPTTAYTVFLLMLSLGGLSVAFVDPKGLVLLVVVLAYAAHVRLLLTGRAEQRRTNELLEELLDAPGPFLPRRSP